jgi:ABC-2 type transport system permease protein
MEISRGIVLKSAGLEAVLPNLMMLIVYTVLVFVFAAWRMKQKVA